MSVDQFIDGLSAEASDAVRRLLRQAYDRGFREALASAGQPAAPPPTLIPDTTPAPITLPVEWAGPAEGDEDAPGAERDDGEEDAAEEEAPVVRPILPRATIGTLRRRITRMFELERFDIDVVICRRGDRDRRQLKSGARLSLYLRREQ